MKILRKVRNTERSGWAMVVTVVVILVAASTASVMMTSSLTSNRLAKVNHEKSSARYRAEGGLAAGQRALLSAVANWQPIPDNGTATIDGDPTDYSITTENFQQTVTDASGIQSLRDRYRIDATGVLRDSQTTAHQIVDVVTVPIFQFAVFYASDLEINPGPSMTLGGRIHTNGDLFMNCGNTLTVDTNYVRAVGDLYRHRKDDPSKSSGTVDVRQWVENPFDPSEPSVFAPLNSASQMSDLGIATVSGYDSNFTNGYDADGNGDYLGPNDWLPWTLGALEYWDQPDGYMGGSGSTIQTGDHGIAAAEVPSINSIGMFDPVEGGDYSFNAAQGIFVPVAPGTGTHAKGFFHGQAGLSILTLPDGTWQAFDGSGSDVTFEVSGAVEVTTIYDARQGGDVQVTQVDMAALNASGVFPDNGLLYASSYETGTGTEMKGVQLVNGSELNAALSVVTDGAAYVQGDYNVDNKKGASVIADAVNLLSNSWDGSKGPGDLPGAAETTYNMAFITGSYETQVGAYNGGFENLPRFHENWSGVNCNITGSFVNAWDSQFATGGWQYGGDRYKAPRRNWMYDPFFNDVANLPPFTPSIVLGESIVAW